MVHHVTGRLQKVNNEIAYINTNYMKFIFFLRTKINLGWKGLSYLMTFLHYTLSCWMRCLDDLQACVKLIRILFRPLFYDILSTWNYTECNAIGRLQRNITWRYLVIPRRTKSLKWLPYFYEAHNYISDSMGSLRKWNISQHVKINN